MDKNWVATGSRHATTLLDWRSEAGQGLPCHKPCVGQPICAGSWPLLPRARPYRHAHRDHPRTSTHPAGPRPPPPPTAFHTTWSACACEAVDNWRQALAELADHQIWPRVRHRSKERSAWRDRYAATGATIATRVAVYEQPSIASTPQDAAPAPATVSAAPAAA